MNTSSTPRGESWRRAALHGVPIVLFMLALYAYWFGFANRYSVFLYEHLNATPFDEVTRSRYWMAGLVASGLVLILYNGILWLVSRFRAVTLPAWWQVWTVAAVPLVPGVLIITMTMNAPTLPFSLAAASALAVLIGLALVVLPASLAAEHPMQLALLAGDGLPLALTLLLMPAVELPGEGLSVSPVVAYGAAAAGVIAGAVGLGIMTLVYRWRRMTPPAWWQVFLAGLAWAYLLLPVAHYLLATPPEAKYITTAQNFFANHILLQIVAFGAVVGLAWFGTAFRTRKSTAEPITAN